MATTCNGFLQDLYAMKVAPSTLHMAGYAEICTHGHQFLDSVSAGLLSLHIRIRTRPTHRKAVVVLSKFCFRLPETPRVAQNE